MILTSNDHFENEYYNTCMSYCFRQFIYKMATFRFRHRIEYTTAVNRHQCGRRKQVVTKVTFDVPKTTKLA